ncbi:MAG: hypothetical protein HY865_18735 [Chloroflexi bacterium]|nr:hypothetical protein [Chloroflexota bacterium]
MKNKTTDLSKKKISLPQIWQTISSQISSGYADFNKRFTEKVVSKIPGTAAYKARIQTIILSDVRKYLHFLKEIDSINPATKAQITPNIRFHESRLSIIYIQTIIQNEFRTAIRSVGIVAILIGTPFLSAWFYNLQIDPIFFIGYIFAYLIVKLIWNILMSIIDKVSLVLPKNMENIPFYFGIVATPVICIMIISQNYSSHLNTSKVFLEISPLLSLTGFALNVIVSESWSLLLNFWKMRQKKSRYPDSVIIDGLLNILYTVEKFPQKWDNLITKKYILNTLDEIGSATSKDLPKTLQTAHTATNIWTSQTYEQIAASFYSLQKWVITPKKDTREFLISRIAKDLTLTALGNWDQLEKNEPSKVSRTQRIHQIANIFRTLLIAVLPLSVLYVIQISIDLQGDLLNYSKIGGFIWAVVTLLNLLDPSLNKKIVLIKDLFGLIPKNQD